MDNDDVVPIAIMGPTGSGKSTFINLASGSNLKVGNDLHSCTLSVESSPVFEADGRRVVLIDTPGFDDTVRSDTDVLRLIATYMSVTYQQDHKLAGIIYMHRISDNRFAGITKRNFSMFRKLCGDEALTSVAIITNMWGGVPDETAVEREQQLASDDKFFKHALEGGACMMRHQGNTRDSALLIIKSFFDKPRQTFRIQRELNDEGKTITETAAAIELAGELAEMQKKHDKELRDVKEMLEGALKKKDDQMRRELEGVVGELEKKLQTITHDCERLLPEYTTAVNEAQQNVQNRKAQSIPQEAKKRHRVLRGLRKLMGRQESKKSDYDGDTFWSKIFREVFGSAQGAIRS